MLFECMGICVLSPAYECEMKGSLDYLLIVKYLSILFKFSHSILDWTALLCIFFCFGTGGGETFCKGSVDHIIFRDYLLIRSSFIYRSPTCVFWRIYWEVIEREAL